MSSDANARLCVPRPYVHAGKMDCVAACSNCHGEGCSNAEPISNVLESSSDSAGDEEDFLITPNAAEEGEDEIMDSKREAINYKNEIVGDFLNDSDLDWVDEEMFESDGTSSLIEKMQH